MNQLAKWVVGTVAFTYGFCVIYGLIGYSFKLPISPIAEKVIEWSLPFFGGLMAKTGVDRYIDSNNEIKAKITNDEKEPLPTTSVDEDKDKDKKDE